MGIARLPTEFGADGDLVGSGPVGCVLSRAEPGAGTNDLCGQKRMGGLHQFGWSVLFRTGGGFLVTRTDRPCSPWAGGNGSAQGLRSGLDRRSGIFQLLRLR